MVSWHLQVGLCKQGPAFSPSHSGSTSAHTGHCAGGADIVPMHARPPVSSQQVAGHQSGGWPGGGLQMHIKASDAALPPIMLSL